jgi:hypothetical protein
MTSDKLLQRVVGSDADLSDRRHDVTVTQQVAARGPRAVDMSSPLSHSCSHALTSGLLNPQTKR